MKRIAILLCFVLCLAACGIKGVGGSSGSRRGERLAMERGRLIDATDPVSRVESYIVIANLLLSFAADAAREQEYEELSGLLGEYSQTIRTARETAVTSERLPNGQRPGLAQLQRALRTQVRTLEDLRSGIDAAGHGPVDQAIQLASSIGEELLKMS